MTSTRTPSMPGGPHSRNFSAPGLSSLLLISCVELRSASLSSSFLILKRKRKKKFGILTPPRMVRKVKCVHKQSGILESICNCLPHELKWVDVWTSGISTAWELITRVDPHRKIGQKSVFNKYPWRFVCGSNLSLTGWLHLPGGRFYIRWPVSKGREGGMKGWREKRRENGVN